MTSPQQQPSHLPKVYWYAYPSSPGADMASSGSVLGVYAMSHAAASSPKNPGPGEATRVYAQAPSGPASSIPAYSSLPVRANAGSVPAPAQSYRPPQYTLGTDPGAIPPLEAPLHSPSYYYGHYAPVVAQRGPDSSPPHMYTPVAPMSSPSQMAVVNSGLGSSEAGSSYYARSSRRMRRKSQEEISYAMNFPAHPVPEHMYVATGPPSANWTVMPPKPNEIRVRRYATGVDDRNFFTVLEYKINDQPIFWDYYTGYVHLTGIWKAIGHAKADIVKLLDNSPELEPIIKRVRGGFLKIQGTWVPFDVAHRLARHICYYIRYALVPLFGPNFPSECTKPDEPGFGELHLNQPYPQLAYSHHMAANDAAPRAANIAPATPPTHTFYRRLNLHSQSSSFPSKAPHPHGPLIGQSRHTRHHSDGYASRDERQETLKDNGRRRRESGGSRPRASSGPHHHRSDSFNSVKRAIEKQRVRVETSPETGAQNLLIDAVSEGAYDENVFEDDDLVGSISPPPMPRKLSFRDEERVSESPSEFVEMLKATRSLQQMSTGRRSSDNWNRTGGGFECAGRQFRWDGSDRLEVVLDAAKELGHQTLATQAKTKADVERDVPGPKRELTPPTQADKPGTQLPSLAKILNSN